MAAGAGFPALILAAGLGSRCRPLTYVRAKPALPVAGKPLIERLVRHLVSSGTTDIVVNLHHKPETIEKVLGDGLSLGARIRYSRERTVLGSAGGPRRALPLLAAERFLILNGDTLCQIDLQALARAHADSGAAVTMATVPNPDPARYGSVYADREGVVRSFGRPGSAPPSEDLLRLHFVGIQMVEAGVFSHLSPDEPSESVSKLYPELIASRPGSIRVFETSARFYDIGTPADYLATSLEVAASEGLHDLPAGRNLAMGPGATLTRTAVWDEVTIGPDCRLVDCVVTDGVNLPPGTELSGCAIVAASDLPEGLAADPGPEMHVASIGPAPCHRGMER